MKNLEVGDFFCIGLSLGDSLGGHVQRLMKKKNSGVVRSRDESPILSQSQEITPWHVHLKTILI